MDDEQQRQVGDERDRLEVLERVVADALVEVRVGDERRERGQHHGAAVGRRLGERGERDAAALPGPVLDDDGLAEGRSQALGEDARDEVGRLAGREAHQDLHDLAGLRVRRGAKARGGKCCEQTLHASSS